MEGAPLRPVPSRPPAPVDPTEAIRYVAAELSPLDAPAVEALALVELLGRSRDEVLASSALSPAELADALARARKTLRRRLYPLPGSGWCERAERLISDRIDGVLEPPGPARLAAHLGTCSRCVDHERRLGQAQDGLVTGFVEATRSDETAEPDREPEPEPEPAPEPPSQTATPPAALRVVGPGMVRDREGGPESAQQEGRAELPEADRAQELPGPESASELPEPPPLSAPPASPQKVPPPAQSPAAAGPAARPPQTPRPSPAPTWRPVEAYPRPAGAPSTTPRQNLPPHLAASLPSDDTWTSVGPLVVVGSMGALILLFALLLAVSL